MIRFNIWISIIIIYNHMLVSSNAKELIILHNGNFLSKFEEITRQNGICGDEDKRDGCLGGFGRMSTKIKELREVGKGGGPAVLYLYSGNLFTGSLWFTVHKAKIAAAMMNILVPEAMSLGFREYKAGTTELAYFLDNVKFPIVSANTNVKEMPTLIKLLKSTILTVKGMKIGIVGHTIERAHSLALFDSKVKFSDELKAVEEEANALKSQGANFIISLGSSDWNIHVKIAEQVENVDLVIGSMKEFLYYNGRSPSGDPVTGAYPYVVRRRNGKKVPVLTTLGLTKFLGCLNLTLSDNYAIASFSGQPIYLANHIEQDTDVLQVLQQYEKEVRNAKGEILGTTRVPLDGSRSSWYLKECNTGNLVTDAFIEFIVSRDKGIYWTDTPAAFIHSGLLTRGESLSANDFVTRNTIMDILPVDSAVVSFQIPGRVLREVFETSVSLNPKYKGQEFLQISGIKIVYDLANKQGSRVKSIEILCASCFVPHFVKFMDNETYRVATTEYLASGRLGYKMLKKYKKKSIDIAESASEIVIQYIKKKRVIYPIVTERIVIEHREAGAERIIGKTPATHLINILFICVFNSLFNKF